MSIRHVVGHGLTLAAIVAGTIGFGLVWDGASAHSAGYLTAGIPLLFCGLWWAGRELGRSNLAARRRRQVGRSPTSRQRESSVQRPGADLHALEDG